MKKLVLTISTMSMFLGSLSALASSSRFGVRQIAHAGSGCPAGSIANDIDDSDGDESVRLSIGSLGMTAEASPGMPLSASRKACQLLIDLAYPSNLQYRVVGVYYSGEAYLSSGTTGVITTTTYFQGQMDQASESVSMFGPAYNSISEFSDFGSHEVWSPCGNNRALNVKISASVRGFRGAHGYISLDGPLGFDPQSLILQFRRCR